MATLAVLGLALPTAARAATEPGPMAAWDGFPADTREVFPQDGMVLPTDTVVTPPSSDFVPDTFGPMPQQQRFRYVSPGVAYGLLHWWATRPGQAAGITVTYRNRQTGWSYATTTDVLGRYRVRVPDGSYDVAYTDPRLPYGVAVPSWQQNATDYHGYSHWDGGLGQGNFDSVIPRPRFSCTIPNGNGDGVDEVVQGADGWAPGADPKATVCPYLGSAVLGDGTDGLQFMVALSTSMNAWGLTGRDPLPPGKDATDTLKIPGASGPATAPMAAATPRIAGSIRATRRGVATVRVRWAAGARNAGRLTLVPSRSKGGKRLATGRVLARGTVRAGASTAVLRLTTAGRRATRAGSTAVSVVWTPAGGPATALSAGRLRAAR